MKLTNVHQIDDFLAAVNKCSGNVYLTSAEGDKFCLKSRFSRYIAIGALLADNGDQLELWCDKQDEVHFYQFFDENPEVL